MLNPTVGSRRRARQRAVIAGLMSLAAMNALAANVRPPDASAVPSFRHPDLSIANVYQPLTGVPATLRPALAVDLQGMGVATGGGFYDLRGGRWGSLILSRPLVPGSGKGNGLTWSGAAPVKNAYQDAVWSAFTTWVGAHQAKLKIAPGELQARISVHENGRVIQIHGARVVGSIPVRGAYVSAVLNGGNLTLFGARHWGTMDAPAQPALTARVAEEVAASHARPSAVAGHWRETHLEIVPLANGSDYATVTVGSGYRHRLVWVVSPAITGDRGTWEALVDAVNGDLLAFTDRNQYEERKVQGGVFPVSNDGQPPDGVEHGGFPMPFADIIRPAGTGSYTNSAGLAGETGGTLRTSLDGRYVKISDSCGPIDEAVSCGHLDLGTSGGTDCAVPTGSSPGNTHSARSGFYELNRLQESARGWLPANAWLGEPLTANMNIDDTCNAFWDGSTVNFFKSGGGCANTGEIAAVFDHEWGHGLDDNDTNPEISSPGEAIADIVANNRLADSCLGRGFRPGENCDGDGDACLTCTGVRELDFAKRASGEPHDIDWILSPTVAPGGGCVGVVGTQFGPCNQETHCEGMVPAEAGWDLWARDLQAGPYGYDFNRSLEVATRLAYVGSGNLGSWYQCSPGPTRLAGCNADGGYLNWLAVDDDNGDLQDGTPHMRAIFGAFDRHQIACATPVVQDSGCAGAPTAAPTVAVSPLQNGAQLSWSSVPGATRYWIFRTEGVRGCSFGKVKVGETAGTEFTDPGLRDGAEYLYSVAAVGAADSCMGPMSPCASVVPAAAPALPQAFLAFQDVPQPFAVLSGDGDAFLDNCETGELRFKVENAGSVDLHNVRLVSVEPVSHPGTQVLTGLPLVLAPTLPAGCGTAAAVTAAAFRFVPHGLTHDAKIDFRVTVTADEVAEPLAGILSVANTESDFQAFASRTFGFEAGYEGWSLVSGTYTRNTPGANATLTHLASSTFTPGQCDRIQSPLLLLSASSALSLFEQFSTEPGTPAQGFFDRANVGIFDTATGARTTVSPDGGRQYNASGPNGVCVTQGKPGWAGAGPGFLASTWSAGALGSAGFAGRPVRVDVAYGTDPLVEGPGFMFDEVTLSNVKVQVADGFSDACTGPVGVLAVDDAATTRLGTPVTIDVIANDSTGSPPLTVTGVTQPAGGTAANNGNGTVTYSPRSSFVGVDSFTYSVCDGAGSCATATVRVTVECDATPTASFSDDFEPEPNPGWTVQTAVTPAGSAAWAPTVDSFAHSLVRSFSSDATALDLKDDRLVAPPQDLSPTSRLVFWHRFRFENTFDGGVLELSPDGGATWVDVVTGGGSFIQGGYNRTIAPNFGSPIAGRAAWSGNSQFVNAMDRVEVNLGAFAGTAVLVRWRLAADPLAPGALPGLGWFVDDVQFTDTLETPSQCALPPEANDDTAETREATPVVIEVLANDSDANGDALTLTSVTTPAHGSATANADHTITYAPAFGFTGTDSFQYTVSDGHGGSDTATVTVTVTPNPTSSDGKVSGNGWIPKTGGQADFGFDIRSKGGVANGRISYDCKTGICLKGNADHLTIAGDQASFTGSCQLGNGSACTFTVVVEDHGDPGRGRDRFSIEVRNSAGQAIHQAGDALGGGNIKLE